jgi:hypothetical protein
MIDALSVPSTVATVHVHSKVRSESEVNPAEEVRMAIQAHLVELERKHRILESELHDALRHPSTDDLRIAELKRRKLMLRDEIERLKLCTVGTLH